jgi:hypoxanthine phosphoribosyltransferase
MAEFVKHAIHITDYIEDIFTLAEKIKDSGKKYKYVYGIPRGGLMVAVYLSHELEIELIMDLMEVVFEENSDILIVDDLTDTGKTLKEYYQYDCAVLYKKPRSTVKPKFFIEETADDTWLVFPYEKIDEIPNREL